MNLVSTLATPPASRNVIGTAAGSQWSFGRLLSRAIVTLIGIAVGCFIGLFIGLLTGWIEIQLC
jgi:ABC-type nitrate/sulfonate/bicarbonate transport system permease component